MRGLSLISGVLFMAIILVSISIIYSVGVPMIQKIQCASTVEKMKSAFVELDKSMQEVVGEGEGAKRTVTLSVDEGSIVVDSQRDIMYWEHECPSPVFSPRTFQTIGNVLVGSNVDVSATEGTCKGEDAYILENDHMTACFRRIGSPSNMTAFNMSDVLISVYQKDLGRYMPLKYLDITINDDPASSTGEGYTELVMSGYTLPYGTVRTYMESDYGMKYYITFTLESGSDFIIIKGE